MTPWKAAAQNVGDAGAVGPVAAVLAALAGTMTGSNAVMMFVWSVLVVLDFATRGITIFLDDATKFDGPTAVRGLMKKMAYLAAVIIGALIDITLSILPTFGEALLEASFATKTALAVLIATEASSGLRNILDATENRTLYDAMMRLVDRIRAPDGQHADRRWHDDKGQRRKP